MKKDYPYAYEDPRSNRKLYMYSAYGGEDFLAAWRESRRAFLEDFEARAEAGLADVEPADDPPGPVSLDAPGSGPVDTLAVLTACRDGLYAGDTAPPLPDWLQVLARKVEVAKRVYRAYGDDLRPAGDPPQELSADQYAELAHLLALGAQALGDVRWLNALLKLNDLLCKLSGELSPAGCAAAGRALRGEVAAVGRRAGADQIRMVCIL